METADPRASRPVTLRRSSRPCGPAGARPGNGGTDRHPCMCPLCEKELEWCPCVTVREQCACCRAGIHSGECV